MIRRVTEAVLRAGTIGILLLVAPAGIFGQSNTQRDAAGSDSQVLQDILRELRLLRADLVRTTVDANRSQVLLERVRSEQEQVLRLTRELATIDSRLSEIRFQQQEHSAALDNIKGRSEAGLTSEEEVKKASDQLDDLSSREQALVETQNRLNGELQTSQANLADLNSRLDELDQDMARPARPRSGGGKEPTKPASKDPGD